MDGKVGGSNARLNVSMKFECLKLVLDLKAFKLLELHLTLYESIALGLVYNFAFDCKSIG
jgi:hypothetical protein